jgi:UDP:flavonoid glycosyltransferase YjiC (YdhE family)
MLEIPRVLNPILEKFCNDAWKACQGAEAIIHSLFGNVGYHIAEALNIPCIAAPLQPITRTRVFPFMYMYGRRNLGDTGNMLTYKLHEQLFWQPVRRITNTWRQTVLNLPKLGFFGPFAEQYRTKQPFLYGFSPAVLPRPSDWPESHHITGYWFLDSHTDWNVPPDLVEFIKAGTPPVYVGFGSMVGHNPEELTQCVVQALKSTGQRGILLTGWSGLCDPETADNVFVVKSVPHDWLFPRMAAVVHHGGAGTTAAGLRAGIPSIIVPFFADQFLWGARVESLGVGPSPIPRSKLTTETLMHAITTTLTDQRIKKCANSLGKRIRAEDGVQKACKILHTYLYGIKNRKQDDYYTVTSENHSNN